MGGNHPSHSFEGLAFEGLAFEGLAFEGLTPGHKPAPDDRFEKTCTRCEG